MEIKNGRLHWVPSEEQWNRFKRGGQPLPDVLTGGYAGSDELGPYVQFDQIRLTPTGKPELEKLWKEATAIARPESPA